jgi:methyl-accepting chemotaxis protein
MFKNLTVFSRILSIILLSNLLFILFTFLFVLPKIKTSIYNERKQSLKAPVEMVYHLLDSMDRQSSNEFKPLSVVQSEVNSIINKLKYDSGKNYIWIHNDKNIFVVHPNPKNIGKNMTNVADENGVKFIAEMTKIALKNGDGYVEYMFPKPIDVNTPLPKVSYVKYYSKWEYIIGTGVWIDDIEREISEITRAILLGSIIIVLLTVSISIYISFSISKPLKKATDKIIRLSEGDF